MEDVNQSFVRCFRCLQKQTFNSNVSSKREPLFKINPEHFYHAVEMTTHRLLVLNVGFSEVQVQPDKT